MTTPNDAYVPDGPNVVAEDKIYQHSIEKSQVSLGSTEDIGLWVDNDGERTNPDLGSTRADFYVKDGTGDFRLVRSAVPDNPEDGLLVSRLSQEETMSSGVVKVEWHYAINGVAVQYDDYFAVLGYMPEWNALTIDERNIVRQVKWMFDDLYDSVNGGPHLQEEFQTYWNLNRYAQLLRLAVNAFNMTSQPFTDFGVGVGTKQIPVKYQGVIVKALYIEVLKHFVRSYVEQPSTSGGPGVAYLDRRDYMNRWQGVLQAEQAEFKELMPQIKLDFLPLGRGSVLVSGGIFPNISVGRAGIVGMRPELKSVYPVSSVYVVGG